jgi:hypothetical protein
MTKLCFPNVLSNSQRLKRLKASLTLCNSLLESQQQQQKVVKKPYPKFINRNHYLSILAIWLIHVCVKNDVNANNKRTSNIVNISHCWYVLCLVYNMEVSIYILLCKPVACWKYSQIFLLAINIYVCVYESYFYDIKNCRMFMTLWQTL